MSRYADPTSCPDCRQPIQQGAPRCSHCQLPLLGVTASMLFQTLRQADDLVARLRAEAPGMAGAGQPAGRPAGMPATGPLPQPGAPAFPGGPAPYPAPHPAPSTGLSAASVPKILLGLGATCLLVAALVFLAVAWSALGMGGRTAVLLTLTAAAGGLMVWMARKSLRAGAESFAVVALGLLALDLSGAHNAGWFGDLHGDWMTVVLGVAVATAGAGVGLWAMTSPVQRIAGAEVVSAIGLATAVAGWLATDVTGERVGLTLGVVLSLAVAVLAVLGRLVVLAVGAATSAVAWWVGLVGAGVEYAARDLTADALLGEARLWPLVVATLLMAAAALPRRFPDAVRLMAAALAGVTAAVTATIVTYDDSLTRIASAWLVVLVLATAACLAAPGRWRWPALAPMGLAGLVVAGTAAVLTAVVGERLADEPWSVPADAVLVGRVDVASPLLLVPSAVALVAALWAAARAVGLGDRIRIVTVATVAGLVAALAGATTLAAYEVPLWSVVVTLLAATVAAVVVATVTERAGWHLFTLVAGAAAVAAALPSSWLALAALATVTLAAGFVDLAGSKGVVKDLAAGTSVAALGATLWTGGHLALVGHDWRVLVVIGVLGALALARPQPPYEISAWGTAVVPLALTTHDASWLAAHLTLAGALVVASSLLHAHRRPLAWVGTGVLAVAMWLRLWDLGVDTVEWYTLPVAAALVAVGAWKLWQGGESTLKLLTPGLLLATVPSLLVALVEPVSLRALLLGLGCAALVVVGVWLRWSSPLLVGAVVGSLLVLREATYADVLPQWVVIGLVGALLTVIGVTWERRLQDLRAAAGYVRALR